MHPLTVNVANARHVLASTDSIAVHPVRLIVARSSALVSARNPSAVHPDATSDESGVEATSNVVNAVAPLRDGSDPTSVLLMSRLISDATVSIVRNSSAVHPETSTIEAATPERSMSSREVFPGSDTTDHDVSDASMLTIPFGMFDTPSSDVQPAMLRVSIAVPLRLSELTAALPLMSSDASDGRRLRLPMLSMCESVIDKEEMPTVVDPSL